MSKRALIAKYLNDIRASYWFLPTLLAFLAVLLSQGTLYVDRNFNLLPEGWRTTQVEGARATLSLISQSMISVAGVMFSVTIVAVSFASGNFGPRLIGNFMRDRGNQWSLGILIATFVYTLIILRAVQSEFGAEGDVTESFVPHFSIFIAFKLTAVSIMSMIYFVHHIPEIINVSNISADLGQRLKTALSDMVAAQEASDEDDAASFPETNPDMQLCLVGSGYIQTWAKDTLAQAAKDHDLYFSILKVAGDFVTDATPVVAVWGKDHLSDEVLDTLRDCFALGPIPTEPQNVLFTIDQLVEMVARAMSPGVNDPFTANNCINWMYVGLSAAKDMKHHPPVPRVAYRSITFQTLIDRSFKAILPYIKNDVIVMDHLEKTVGQLLAETQQEETAKVLKAFQSEVFEASEVD